MPKRPTVPIQGQITVLSKDFPNCTIISHTYRHLVWETDVVPTANSSSYRIRIDYTLDDAPKIYVVRPEKLRLATGQDKLPHVFSTPEQQICPVLSWIQGVAAVKSSGEDNSPVGIRMANVL